MFLALVLVEEEVEEDGGSEEVRLHLRRAAGGEVDHEAVAVGEQLLAHVGGGLRDGPHLLPLHVADDKVSLERTSCVYALVVTIFTCVQQQVVRRQGTWMTNCTSPSASRTSNLPHMLKGGA